MPASPWIPGLLTPVGATPAETESPQPEESRATTTAPCAHFFVQTSLVACSYKLSQAWGINHTVQHRCHKPRTSSTQPVPRGASARPVTCLRRCDCAVSMNMLSAILAALTADARAQSLCTLQGGAGGQGKGRRESVARGMVGKRDIFQLICIACRVTSCERQPRLRLLQRLRAHRSRATWVHGCA